MVGPHFLGVLESGVQALAGQDTPSLSPIPSRFLMVVDLSPGESHWGKQVFLSEMNSLHLGTMKCGRTMKCGHGLKMHVLAFCRIFAMAISGWQWDLLRKAGISMVLV